MKQLHHLVNIIPVIAKADTLTAFELKRLKTRVMQEIYDNDIQVYIGEGDDDDEAEFKELRVGNFNNVVNYVIYTSATYKYS